MPTEKAIIIGFTDDPDGTDAHITALRGEDYTDLAGVFKTALTLLTTCDHVCITDLETYDKIGEEGYFSYLPYSIDMSIGHLIKNPVE